MAGSITGGKQAAETNKKRYGKDYYVKMGAKGGAASKGTGTAMMSREKVVEMGRKGGLVRAENYKTRRAS